MTRVIDTKPSGIKNRWNRLSRSDRIAWIVAESAVIAGCLYLLLAFRPLLTAADWQGALVGVGLVFIFPQFLVVLVVSAISVSRRPKIVPTEPTASPIGIVKAVTGFGRFVSWFVMAAVVWFVGGYTAEWLFPENEWATKWRYSLENDLNSPVYMFDKAPHNCEFWTAPIGNKHCHYDKVVRTIRIRTVSGRRLVSYDEGKTWENAEVDARSSVFVSWQKVEE